MIADAEGRAIGFAPTQSQSHELPHAIPLLAHLPSVQKRVVDDRGYSGEVLREHVRDLGARPAISPRRTEASVACPAWIYTNRNRVKRLWAKLKEWHAVTTRYEKTASSFLGVLNLSATLDWLRRYGP